jgi:formylglycine-generating enzyme required for sulfatase activity
MHGNVSQMVEDYFGELPKGAVVDYQGTKNGVFRVTKGSHFDEETEISGISNRGGVGSMSNDQNTIGFRLVREPK